MRLQGDGIGYVRGVGRGYYAGWKAGDRRTRIQSHVSAVDDSVPGGSNGGTCEDGKIVCGPEVHILRGGGLAGDKSHRKD